MKKLLILFLLFPFIAKAQTTPLSFTSYSFSLPDFTFTHGRGLEEWNSAIGQINNVSAVQAPAGVTKHSNVYYRFNWIDIENLTQGSYNWSVFDSKVNSAISQGSTFSLGIMTMCTACGLGNLSYPTYLHNAMQADPVVNNRDWLNAGGDWVPNWNSEIYLSRLEALLNAIAAHINTTSFNGKNYKDVIYYVDVRGYGDFGEWHTYPWTNTEPAGRKATITSLKRIIDAHKTAFPNYPLVVPMGAFDTQHDSQIPAEVGYYVLTTTNSWGQIGWRRDNVGDDGYNDWIEFNPGSYNPGSGAVSLATLAMNKWKYGIVGGEPVLDAAAVTRNGNTSNAYYDYLNEVTKFHMSSVGNGNYPFYPVTSGPNLVNNVIAAAKAMGYRIEPTGGSMTTTLTQNANFTVTLNWKNSGVSPSYQKWKVQYQLKNAGGTAVASWNSYFTPFMFLPTISDSVVTDVLALGSVTPGTYSLTVKVLDSTGYRTPMELAITGRNADGSYNVRTGITVQAGNANLTVNAGSDQVLSSGTISSTLSGSYTTTDTADVILIWGESNASGIAPNASATAGELTAHSNVKIYVSGTDTYDNIKIGGAGFNNHNPNGFSTDPINQHGMELGLLAQADSGMFKNPVYIIKSGVSGSYMNQWLPGQDASDWWTSFLPYWDAAFAKLNSLGIKYRVTVWSSIGLNDRFNQSTTATNYRTRLQSFISNFRTRYGSEVRFILMDFFNNQAPPGQGQTDWLWASELNTIAAADSKVKVVSVQGADYIDGSVHFAYNGMKLIAQRMVDSTRSFWNTSTIWTKVSGPAGGNIGRSTRPVSAVTGLVNGTYTFRLSVTSNNTTLSDEMILQVGAGGGNLLPSANAGVDKSITLPTNSVTLIGSGSDPDGTISSYSWSKVSGGSATIVSPTLATTNITSLVEGTYVFRLTVTDNSGGTGTDDVQVIVNPAAVPSYAPTVFGVNSANTTNGSITNSLTGLPANTLLVLTLSQPDDASAPSPTSGPTSTPALTWTKRVDAQAGNSGNVEIWTAVYPAGGSISVSTTWTGFGPTALSGVLYGITGYDTNSPFGAIAVGTAQTLPSVNITTTKENSLLIGAISDWNAITSPTRVYLSQPVTEAFFEFFPAAYCGYHFRKPVTVVNTYTLGLSDPTGQASGIAVIEIKGTTIVPPLPDRNLRTRLKFRLSN